MYVSVVFWGNPIFFLKKGIEMRAVCEFQPGSYRTDGFAALRQVLCRFFQAECHAVVIEAHVGKLVDNAVQVIPAVVEHLLQLGSCHASVACLKKAGNACKEQKVTIFIKPDTGTVVMVRGGQIG